MNAKNRIVWVVVVLVVILVCVLVVAAGLLVTNLRTTQSLPATIDVALSLAQTFEAVTLTAEAAPKTSTPAATRTPAPSSTPRPTKTATATVTPFPTLPTHTATLPGLPPAPDNNPRSLFSDPPTWRDSFENDNAWTLFDDNCFKTEVRDDKYIQIAKRASGSTCWEVTWPRIQNFYLETSSHIPGSCSGKDRFGILFRAPTSAGGYLFGLTCDEEYWLARWDSETNQGEFLIDYTEHDAIVIAPGADNVLGVYAANNMISLYINNRLVDKISDSTFTGAGLIGYFIGATETEGFTVEYNDLQYWSLP